MTQQKILEVVAFYRKQFEEKKIPKKRADVSLTLQSLTSGERLAHAHFLLDGIEEYAKDPERTGKTGRHLGAVQMILTYEGWYTLGELMNHNRPQGGWHECMCSCHGENGEVLAVHCIPCCERCPWCGLNISGNMDAHVYDEHPEQEDQTPPMGSFLGLDC